MGFINQQTSLGGPTLYSIHICFMMIFILEWYVVIYSHIVILYIFIHCSVKPPYSWDKTHLIPCTPHISAMIPYNPHTLIPLTYIPLYLHFLDISIIITSCFYTAIFCTWKTHSITYNQQVSIPTDYLYSINLMYAIIIHPLLTTD